MIKISRFLFFRFYYKIENFSNNIINLPKSELIDIQFQNRLIYIIVNDYTDDQRSSELYWLGIPTPSLLDDVDYGQDETTTNTDETNEKVFENKIKILCLNEDDSCFVFFFDRLNVIWKILLGNIVEHLISLKNIKKKLLIK